MFLHCFSNVLLSFLCDDFLTKPELVHKRKDEVRGFYNYRSNGSLLAAVWFDRRFIYFLSTLHTAEIGTPVTVKRTSQDGSRNDVPCPPLLPDYQQYMRGVDRGDQLIDRMLQCSTTLKKVVQKGVCTYTRVLYVECIHP